MEEEEELAVGCPSPPPTNETEEEVP